MVFYILLFVYALLCFVRRKSIEPARRKKAKVFLLFLPMFFLAAFRDVSIGPDTFAYYRIFNQISQSQSIRDAVVSSQIEPGYVFLNYVFGRAGLNYYWMQVFLTAFIFFSIGRFIYKYSEDIYFSCFLFLANHLLFGIMNVVRMWIAVAVLLFSVESLKKKKFLQFLLIVCIAMAFHYSALVFILMYPIVQTKLTAKKVSIIFLVAIAIWRFALPFFTYLTNLIGLYGNYLDGSRFDTSDNVAVVLTLLISLCFFAFEIYGKSWKKKESAEKGIGDCTFPHEYSIAFCAMIFSVAINIIGLSNNIMGRVVHYFSTFGLILIPHTFSCLKNAEGRTKIKIVMVTLLCCEYAVIMIFRPEWYQVVPYHTFVRI